MALSEMQESVDVDGCGGVNLAFFKSTNPINGQKKSRYPKSDTLIGTPEGIRTPDLLVRSQTLYPAELLAHSAVFTAPSRRLLIYNIMQRDGCQHFFDESFDFLNHDAPQPPL